MEMEGVEDLFADRDGGQGVRIRSATGSGQQSGMPCYIRQVIQAWS